jgi:GNAT superfamily N-acetyltransferase
VEPQLREAAPADAETVLAFMRELNESQGYPFLEPAARGALLELLGSPALGRVWLVLADGFTVGYVVLTLGFSLEYGGRDAFVDELYVRRPHRGRGLGGAALAFVLGEARRLGVRAVHLEVERTNRSAERLYAALGFADNERRLLTRRLAGPAGDGD